MLLPLFDSFTTKPTSTPTISISQNSSVSSTETSPTKQTYSYSGPPKSYYSRLPLYDRPFKCDQCPQSFNRNHDLKRHKRIHLAVKPYPCQYCDKQFSRKDALKRHILVKGCNKGSTTVDGINANNTSNNKTSDIKNNNNNKVDESSISSTNYVDENAIKSEPSLGMSI
ncbi:hypothetical protein C1645_700357 [Glomus cerebriforme]|uniref:C2H2-type domain-containing protein n=1 Tax=Glomus cerebriforme TaxID=658196 RepID=A0A397SBN4_9GLOM|nr:hypothetical protein C1645_700357 [Glomus cerebriforme]